jgi:hypothetical protein
MEEQEWPLEDEVAVKRHAPINTITLSMREWQVVTVLILTKDLSDKVRLCEILEISMRNLDVILYRLKRKLIET